MQACRRQKAVLLIAKLDRLSRSVAFISKLMKAKIEFVAVDFPAVDKLTLYMRAVFAEHERDMISVRTKEALQAAKIRGVELGRYGREVLAKRNRDSADPFALAMEPLIIRLRKKGIITVRRISSELNLLNVATFRGDGCKWHPYTVCVLMKRITDIKARECETDKRTL